MDKKLSFGQGQPKEFEGKEIRFLHNNQGELSQQAKSLYVGTLCQGKYHNNGCFIDQYEHYEGDFYMGLKQGYGKLQAPTYKYLGYF